ncbi:MAG: hypothetical protein V1831_01550 [Candidatus Woesearchaeota archaeon]
MLHLTSEEGIAYLGRLEKEIQSQIKRFEREVEEKDRNKTTIKKRQYAPLSFYFLNTLINRQQELLKYYLQKGYDKNGLYIAPSGFPSAPSLLADVKSIKENLLEYKINELNPLIEKDKQTLGSIEQRLRELDLESLQDLKPIENHKNKLERQKYSLDCEVNFFTRFLRESDSIKFVYEGKKSKSTFKFSIFDDKDDNFFYLMESAKKLLNYIEEHWKGFGDYKGTVNVLRARYLDSSIYSLDNPMLIIATQGNTIFSTPFKFQSKNLLSKVNSRTDIMINYPEIFSWDKNDGLFYDTITRYYNDKANPYYKSPVIYTTDTKDGDNPTSFEFPGKIEGHYNSDEEWNITLSKDFFLKLLSVFPEEGFSNNHRPNPEAIFELYRTVCDYRKIIDPISIKPRGEHLSSAINQLDPLKKLAGIMAQDTVYGDVARNYLKSYTLEK